MVEDGEVESSTCQPFLAYLNSSYLGILSKLFLSQKIIAH